MLSRTQFEEISMSLLMSALESAVSKHYPGIPLSSGTRFLPMLDLSKGELSSSAAIEIARATRSSAMAVAERLLGDLVPVCGGQWRVDAGYLVLRQIPDSMFVQEAQSAALADRTSEAQPGAEREIVALVPDVTTPVYARLRVIACAALQAVVTVAYEGQVWLGFEPEGSERVTGYGGVVSLVKRAVARVLANEAEVRREMVSPFQKGTAAQPSTVWTAHHYFDRLATGTLGRLNGAREEGRIVIRMPNDGWLLARERALSELLSASHLQRVIDRLESPVLWLRWIFHAASPTASGDFDPAVALYDEGASPLWNMQVLVERFERLIGPIRCSESPPALCNVQPVWRALVLRALFFPVWSARAIREGEIPAWSQVLQDLSVQGHALLNSPTTRAALASGGLQGELKQIVASVEFGLSSILSVVATEERWQG
jgi:hypothetical protein